MACTVKASQVEHGSGMSLVCRFQIPVVSLFIILFDSPPILIQQPQVVLENVISLLSGFPEPDSRLGIILSAPVPLTYGLPNIPWNSASPVLTAFSM